MTNRARRSGRVLGATVAVAMAATALAAGLAAAAGPTACRVVNTDKDIARDSLQRAAWAADPGDTLLVQGICVGTTVVRKNLTIGWIRATSSAIPTPSVERSDSGPPTLRSGSWRPTLIIDPAVDDLRIHAGGTIKQGFVIGDPEEWRGVTRNTAPRYWSHWGRARPALGGYQRRTIDDCAVWNASGLRRFDRLPAAIDEAGAGARLVLAGKCWGKNEVEQRVYVHGSRVPGDHGCRQLDDRRAICIDHVDFGPPRIKGRVVISADVAEVAFKRLTLTGGLRIR